MFACHVTFASITQPGSKASVLNSHLCSADVFTARYSAVLMYALTTKKGVVRVAYEPHENRLNLIILVMSKEDVADLSSNGRLSDQAITSSARLHFEVGEASRITGGGPLHLKDIAFNPCQS
jgi:hypothetical protein